VRATYVRTTGSILQNDPDGWLSDGNHGPVWWLGLDSGGGRYPIGPNGPYPGGVAGVPAVIRATALITGPLTAAPFRVLDGGAVGAPIPAPPWITDPHLLRPDLRPYSALTAEEQGAVRQLGSYLPATEQLPRGEFWTEFLRASIWWGMGAFIYRPNAIGEPIAGTLKLVHPRTLTARRDMNSGASLWVIPATDDYPEVVFDRAGYAEIGGVTWRLVVMRNPHSPVDDDGLSRGVFELAPQAFGFAAQVDGYASSTFKSGVPAGYLKVETPGLQQTQADALKTAWMNAHGGDRRSIAVLNATTSFNPISLSPIDAALGESKRLSIADVAFAFGLDPLTLGISLANSATYTNVQQAWANHRDFGLSLWISALQDTLSALLPGSQGVAVNLDGFAQPEASERYASYAAAITAGILTVDEVRALEGLPPSPEPPPAPVPPQLETEPAPVPAADPVAPPGRAIPFPLKGRPS
jgi:HK97 family phage portal protein